jgi:hypothetical protein
VKRLNGVMIVIAIAACGGQTTETGSNVPMGGTGGANGAGGAGGTAAGVGGGNGGGDVAGSAGKSGAAGSGGSGAGEGGAGGSGIGNEDLPTCKPSSIDIGTCSEPCYKMLLMGQQCPTGLVCCPIYCRRPAVNNPGKPPPLPNGFDGKCDTPDNCAPGGALTGPDPTCTPLSLGLSPSAALTGRVALRERQP